MKKYEFKPDRFGENWIEKLYLTKQQQSRLLKWSLYTLICILLLVFQDAAFSINRPLGGTIDMIVAAIFIVCLLENLQEAAKFALILSLIYVFSGSAPGYHAVILITFLGVFAAVFRQGYLQEGAGAVFLCAGVSVMLYEIASFGIALIFAKTYFGAWIHYVMTGVNSVISALILYPILRAVSKIGGETWRD